MKDLISAPRDWLWLWRLARRHGRSGVPLGSTEESIAKLKKDVSPLARAAWRSLICNVDPHLDPKARAFFTDASGSAIGNKLWPKLLDAWVEELAIQSNKIEVHQGSNKIFPVGGLELRAEFLSQIFTYDTRPEAQPSPLLSAALIDGYYTCPSPVDGVPLTSNASLPLRYDLHAYRFVDSRHSLVFYVVSPVFGAAQVRAVYFPGQQICFVCPGWVDHVFKVHFGAALDALFVRHVLAYAADIEDYLRAPSRSPSLILVHANTAHHLWNEVGEIDRVLGSGATNLKVLLVDGANLEHYGLLDQVFSELRGKVVRYLRAPQLARFVYRERLCIFGPCNKYIPARLRARLLAFNEARADLKATKASYRRFETAGLPVVLFGLRPHNRTLMNQAEFFADLIDFIAREAGKAVVVFDGWNDRGTDDFIRIEKKIVEDIRKRVNNSKVEMIDLIGRPMSESLFWSSRADFFVSIFGAGMAKYRSICNKPGLVLTGPWNLRHREDLHVFDAVEVMETPSPMIFIGQEDVSDVMDAKILERPSTHPEGSVANFTINNQAAFDIVRRLLKDYSSMTAA